MPTIEITTKPVVFTVWEQNGRLVGLGREDNKTVIYNLMSDKINSYNLSFVDHGRELIQQYIKE